MSDTVLATSGNWSVATDGLQWMLRKRAGTDRRTGKPVWSPVSFVHSTKDILARCMREEGCSPEDAQKLLAGLGERFSPPQASTIERPAKTAVKNEVIESHPVPVKPVSQEAIA
jgi:hypothetical protein